MPDDYWEQYKKEIKEKCYSKAGMEKQQDQKIAGSRKTQDDRLDRLFQTQRTGVSTKEARGKISIQQGSLRQKVGAKMTSQISKQASLGQVRSGRFTKR